ncbi:hypothetical protein [Caulobacter sp. 1776]
MKPATVAAQRPQRRRYAPLILAVVLAALVWAVIALGGAALGAWLA